MVGKYNDLFRGRFQGCDYMDLSPAKEYVYRLVQTSKPSREDAPKPASRPSAPRAEQR